MGLRKFHLFSFLLLGIFLWVSSCSMSVDKKKGEGDDLEIPDSLVNSVSFSQVSAKVFEPRCVACHGISGSVSLESYESAKSVLDKIKQSTILEKRMPKTPNPALSPDERQLLAAWIKAGGPKDALNGNPSDPVLPLPILEAKFDSIKSVIFERKCLSCHSAGGKAERVPLASRDDLINSPLEIVIPGNADESGLIMTLTGQITDKFMPPRDSGISPVKAEDIEIIKEWIKNGATN